MGTGVGEAMVIGAVTGAGTAAVTGGDPLEGAILGAAGGGIGYGIAGPATAVPGAAPITPASAANVIPNATAPGTIAGTSTAGTLTTAQAGLPEAVGQVGTSVMPSGANLQSTMLPSGDIALTDAQRNILASQGAPTAQTAGFRPSLPTNLSAEDTKQASGYFPNLSKLYANNPNLFPAASGAFTSAMFSKPPGLEEEEEYGGPLSDFRYSRSSYTPFRAASGGLMDTAVARRMAGGGLGSYSDGGQTLQGPGDGMSDSIPATIGGKQPARLADGEFVVPADVVSGIGNGSTDAGARQLYSMMDKVREARTGRTRQAPEINPRRMMPA